MRAQALSDASPDPLQTLAEDAEATQPLAIPDAVRRFRWIAADMGATAFGLYFLGPASERSRLVPCFDSDYPGVGAATRALSGSQAEEIARHARASTQPCWWAGAQAPGAKAAFAGLAWAHPVAPPLPQTAGIAFPVHADRGQCGLAIFIGTGIFLTDDTLCDIHARCFSLFGAMARLRHSEPERVRAMSRRELECLRLTANGHTSEEIARLLKLSVHTTNQYLTQSAQKLNAVSRTQAVAKALRLGLIE
ncbi:MAG: helix-turn-helix transcriptional regulator [Mesorhizobium sp.]